MSARDHEDLTGKQIGHYAICRRLGKGGMGAVYLAQDLTLDRPVAIKVLLPVFLHQEDIRLRFEREAKSAAKLNHPNIVQIYGVGLEEEAPYIAMEYVDGAPLDTLIKKDGAMPWQRALTIAGQVTSALECAHAHGIIHRDIKPANILLDRQGRVRVTDFGVAKILQAGTQLTTDGTFIGTPQYMSPEQCGVGEVGPASDLFSLGAMTYEMLAGRLPFHGDTPASLIRKITTDPPDPLETEVLGLPKVVGEFVVRLLEKDPARRYASAHEVLVDLGRIRSGQSLISLAVTTPMEMIGAPATATRQAVRSPAGGPGGLRNVAIAGTALAVILVAVGVAGARIRQKGLQRDAAPSKVSQPSPGAQLPGVESPAPDDPEEAGLIDIDEFFRRQDANHDGVLTGGEIPRGKLISRPSVDANNDGALTKAEIEQARNRMQEIAESPRRMQERRPEFEPLDGAELMKRLDANKDGQIDVAEVPENLRDWARRADSNRDKVLSASEMRSTPLPTPLRQLRARP